jgi:hypothetical protein
MRHFARALHCCALARQDADDGQAGLDRRHQRHGDRPASRATADCAADNAEALVDYLKGLACWLSLEWDCREIGRHCWNSIRHWDYACRATTWHQATWFPTCHCPSIRSTCCRATCFPTYGRHRPLIRPLIRRPAPWQVRQQTRSPGRRSPQPKEGWTCSW